MSDALNKALESGEVTANVREIKQLSKEEERQEHAMIIAKQAMELFKSTYPKYAEYVQRLGTSDLRKVLLYGFRNPFMKEPLSFHSPFANTVYKLSKDLRVAQDMMLLVGVHLDSHADVVEAGQIGEAATAKVESEEKKEEVV
jgi:hypothetical protein